MTTQRHDRPPRRVAHVLWRSTGGIRRHVASIARRPPCGWVTHSVWGPPELAGHFAGEEFHAVSRLSLLTAARDADVIHAHGVIAGSVALLPRRPPVVVSLHVVVGGSGTTARSRVARELAGLVPRRADVLVAVSAAAAEPFPGARVIPPAFEPLPGPSRDRRSVRGELGAGPDEVVAVCVSRLEAEKRPELFISAVQAAGCVGWLVGDGSDRRRIESLALGSRTRVLGHRSDVSDLLSASDVFAMPSASESYGIAVAEAVSAGLPVVATRTGEIATIVGDAGVVVDVFDEDAFAEALVRLVTDPAERERASSAARASGRIDPEAARAALGRAYEDAVSAGTGA